ncbi:hypothetical protein NBRC116597_34410 [Phaeobacter sp. NW0010-22]
MKADMAARPPRVLRSRQVCNVVENAKEGWIVIFGGALSKILSEASGAKFESLTKEQSNVILRNDVPFCGIGINSTPA